MQDALTNEFHPIAAIFPLMDDDALQSLAADIREHGLREPVVRFEGKVLDGRNRLTACRIAGVEPKFREFTGSAIEAVAFSWSVNRERRHLTTSQAAAAEAKRAKLHDGYLAEIKAEAEKRKAEGQRTGGKTAGRNRAKEPDSSPQKIGESKPHDRETASARAKAAGTNRTYIAEADKLAADYPKLLDRVESGQLSIPEASAVRKRLDTLPEHERPRAFAMIDQPGIPPKDAIGILTTISEMQPKARAEVLNDFESDDPRRRNNALCCAAKKPPMPDQRIGLNQLILKQIERAQKIGDEKEYQSARRSIEALQSRLEQEYRRETESLARRRNGHQSQ